MGVVVGVGHMVGVGVGHMVGVGVGHMVGVGVGHMVGVGVGHMVGVGVGHMVGVGIGVDVGVKVGEGVGTGVNVGIGGVGDGAAARSAAGLRDVRAAHPARHRHGSRTASSSQRGRGVVDPHGAGSRMSVQGRRVMVAADGSAPQCRGTALTIPVPQTAVCGTTEPAPARAAMAPWMRDPRDRAEARPRCGAVAHPIRCGNR